jgi:hypothetical protein
LLKEGPVLDAFDQRFNCRAIKVSFDGALGSKGAALLENYSDYDTAGFLKWKEADLLPMFEEALRQGIQVWTHAIGDRANREILNLYAKAFERVPPDQRKIKAPRWRVEHAQIVAPADIPRFAQLGVIPSMQPSHAIGDLHFAMSRLGLKRLEGAYAWQSFIKSGCIVPGGTDAPVERGEPMIEFYAAVARKDLKGFSGEGWHPEQAVTREQALKMFTIWSAYAVFAEGERGSIETGKLADLTVLSQDIMKIPEAEILQTRCLMTVVNGEIVYDDEARASLSPRRREGLRVRGERLSPGNIQHSTFNAQLPTLARRRPIGRSMLNVECFLRFSGNYFGAALSPSPGPLPPRGEGDEPAVVPRALACSEWK